MRHPSGPATPVPPRVAAVLLALALAPSLGACGGGDAPALAALVDTLDGVERVRYPESNGTSLAWSFDTLAVIGGAAVEREEEQFDQVSPAGLAGDAEGNLYVVDGQAKRVLKFGRDGSFLLAFGREGGGPGEFRFPSGLTLGPGDSIWVSDSGNRRISVFAPDGTFGRSIAYADATVSPAGRLVATDDGYVQSLALFSFRPGEDATSPPIPLVRFGREGEALDTLYSAPAPQRDMVTLRAGQQQVTMLMSQAFAPEFRWAVLPDGGVAVSDASEYLIRLLEPDGSPRRVVLRDPPPRATSDADRESERQRLRENSGRRRVLGAAFDTEELLKQQLEKMTFAPLVPRVTALTADPLGRLWVGVSEGAPRERSRIDIYEGDGRLLGELRTGDLFPDLLFADGLAAVLERDELDVQRILLLRVREAPGERQLAG